MPKPKKGARFGGSASHQKALLANLATALFEHGRITTTEAKAKALRPYAEKLVTHAKAGTLENLAELDLRLMAGSGVRQPGHGVIGDDVEQRGPFGKLLRQLSRVLRPVVDAAEQDILECQTTARCVKIAIGFAQDGRQSSLPIDRHQSIAEVVVGGME